MCFSSVMQYFLPNRFTGSYLGSIQASRALERFLEACYCVLCKLPFLTTVTAIQWTCTEKVLNLCYALCEVIGIKEWRKETWPLTPLKQTYRYLSKKGRRWIRHTQEKNKPKHSTYYTMRCVSWRERICCTDRYCLPCRYQ